MKKHRKLFPTSYTNQTLNCDDCYPYCPYDCYQEQIYFPPPPPIRSGHHTTNQFPPYLIAIVVISFGVFLLLGLYALLVKCSSCFQGAGRVLESEATGEEFLDENHGSELDHPIWYIRMVGLQPSTINSITVIKFKKGDHHPSLIEGTDCSVCLNEFQDDETLRLLPKCNHAFHIPCIDTWLRSHTNCPMCRAGILSNDNQSSRSLELGANQNTQIVNRENGAADVDANQVREGEIGEHGEETGAGTEDPKIE